MVPAIFTRLLSGTDITGIQIRSSLLYIFVIFHLVDLEHFDTDPFFFLVDPDQVDMDPA